MKNLKGLIVLLVVMAQGACFQDSPYLSGHIKRAHDAVMTTCDPYGKGVTHSCLIFSAAYQDSLFVYNLTTRAMVLAPNGYFPLRVSVGPTTDELVKVNSGDKNFPFMFALDRSGPKLFTVHLFPIKDKTESSFVEPTSQAIAEAPKKMAAAVVDDQVIGVLTYPNKSSIKLMAFNKDTGEIDATVAPKDVALGSKPSFVAIDSERKVAVITDEGGNNLSVFKLQDIANHLKTGAPLAHTTINIFGASDRLELAYRDFGNGKKLYALAFSKSDQNLRLANIDDAKSEAQIDLEKTIVAAYLPEDGARTCCGDKKNWLSATTINGEYIYVVIETSASKALTLKSEEPIDLKKEGNLSFGKVHFIKMVGGQTEEDTKVKREKICKDNRQIFLIAAFANSPTYLNVEPVEVEGHGSICEGENSAFRFGFDKY